YALRPVTVVTADGARSAQVYWPPETIAPGPIWDLAAWVHEWGALTVSSAPDILRLRRAWAATDTRAIRPFAQARGWARQLAQTGAPATVRHSPAPGDVQATPREDGYDGFFGLRRLDLRYRRFSGDLSDPISREAFMAFDAALVLPYDPDRDSVLLVEQLRYGPIVRTDPNPWVLEPVAGLVDAGEDPADTVRREAQEEAGLTLGRVIALPHAYPSPGYSSEYFHMFIAVTDLSGHSTGLGGLEGESEDIRHHVIPRAHALDLIDSGEINALPLQTMLLWLDRMRHQLRD
ncbi:MAG: NUDIX domain-containing protein, partial [Primorskyibacter sp.]